VSPKTFIGRINWSSLGPNAASGLLGLAAVALIALGIGMIFLPAGVIAAGVGCIALQWLFFGGSGESSPPDDNRRR
jgi:hypothetical protein